jgi:hypothetical protein
MACDVATHLKNIWQAEGILNGYIPATEDDENRFFREGFDLRGRQLPYVVLEETLVAEPAALGAGWVLDNRIFQLRIYTKSKSQAVDLSVAARRAYLSAHPAQTKQGEVKKVKIDGGQSSLLPDGTRSVIHQMNVICVDKIY